MKRKFKQQTCQTHAVDAMVDYFKGQPNLGLVFTITLTSA